MMIESILTNSKNIIIYGAGQIAFTCAKYLEKRNIFFDGFVVSDNNKLGAASVENKQVKHLSDLSNNTIYMFLVAVNKRYWEEIDTELRIFFQKTEVLSEVYFISNEDLFSMKRFIDPIRVESFLNQSVPCGKLMGCDRGTSLSRYYIKKFLDNECKSITNVEDTFEVGDARYSSIYYPKAKHGVLDFSKGMDLTDKTTLPYESYDVFICTQVFNFIYDVKSAIEGAKYVLRKGGFIISTVAGNISQISRSDMNNYGDYWRFTYLSIEKLFKDVFNENEIKCVTFGNAMSTTAYIQGMSFEDLPHSELLDYNDPEYALVIGIVARK